MTSALYLLDTNVVVALVRGGALARHIDAEFGLRASKVRPLISVVTLGEVRVLARRNAWGENKLRALETALSNLVIVDVSPPTVIEAYVDIDINSQSHRDGARNMGKNDLWIAACAKAANALLITTDGDFAHLTPDTLDVRIVRMEAADDRPPS